MPQHQSAASKQTASVLKLIKAFIGVMGSRFGYAMAEGSLDAGDEDRYGLTFHEKGSLIVFYRGWAVDEFMVPVCSTHFLAILRYLKLADDHLPADKIDPLILALEHATRHGEGHLISQITVGYRRRTDMHLA
ncbi:hypothetical protein H8F21_14625 [Pseudomonas sp. P66]|uniref:Uncharacterized protein n=1 Tax=Pseudomonas arcuscaelestis TaxID=2710591 RepID=A0ABS2BZ93_9PSED|nr:hypothetical protein [Pseudomonas arcuscaelestis]MBM5458800.1 hypothetical protein [Pseudomonas arcuscaelestis]